MRTRPCSTAIRSAVAAVSLPATAAPDAVALAHDALQQTAAVGLGLAGVLLCGVAATLRWVLPRLAPNAAWAATAGGVVALALVGCALSVWADAGVAGAVGATAVVVPAIVALVFGQVGLRIGASVAALRKPGRRAPSTRTRPPVDAGATAAPTHARLGRFDVERAVGRGAMGTVHYGRDRTTGQAVALKTLRLGELGDGPTVAEARLRFRREAEAARRLRHPDIVSVIDAGEDRQVAYIAMEWVAGQDLRPHTHADALLPLPEVIEIGARVAEALAYAHSVGVVHRDIKPANLLRDPASGLIKITDFGVARIGDQQRTRTGMLLGTPTYMAPEQLTGAPVDGRADLHALGVTLYQLLTGQLPQRAQSMERLMYEIANVPAPDIRQRRPALPEALAAIVMQLLEKNPLDRPADGATVAAGLRAAAMPLGTPVPPHAAAPAPAGFDEMPALQPPVPGHNSRL